MCNPGSITVLVAEARLGVIGTLALSENRQFAPTAYSEENDVGPQFYLNTEDPATTSGTVERLRFCYHLDEGLGDQGTLYQATFGFYRRPERSDTYVQQALFDVTRNASNNQEGDQFVCEDMDIPSTQVQEGDLIGVCARNFNKSFRRINFAVDFNGDAHKDLRVERPNERNNFCTDIGSAPMSFRTGMLNCANQRLLRIFGFIDGK